MPRVSRDVERSLAEDRFLRSLAASLLGPGPDADDAAQHAWLRGVENPPKRRGSLRAFLRVVLKNRVRALARDKGRRAKHEQAAARPEAVPSAEEMASQEELRRRVGEAVLALDEPYRATIWLRFREQLPPREVARRMGVPVETVRTRSRRALDELRRKLDRSYGDRQGWVRALVPLIGGRLQGATPSLSWSAGLAGVMAMKKILAGAAVAALVAVVVLEALPVPLGPPAQDTEGESVQGMVATAPDVEAAVAVTRESTRSELGANASVAEEGPVLSIRVTRSDTGEVIPRLGLSFMRLDTRLPIVETVLTDDDGLATIQPIDPGELVVLPAGGSIHVAETGTTHQDIVLDPQFEVQGIVLDPTGSPLAGASILTTRGNRSGHDVSLAATTGLDGRFSWTAWSGLERVHATMSGFSPSPAYDLYYYLGAPPFLRIILRPSEGALSGAVVDEMARPVAGAAIYLTPPTPPPVDPEAEQGFFKSSGRWGARRVAHTDQDGRFRFEELHSGLASLRVRAQDFSQKLMTLEVDRGPDTEVTIVLEPPLSVSGLVTSSVGRPLKNALVSVGMMGGVEYVGTHSDPDGSYVLEGLAPGRIAVDVAYPRHESVRETLSGEAGQKLRLDLVLLEQRYLRGQLLDEADAPLDGWRVQEKPGSRPLGVVDSEGRFEWPWVGVEPPELIGRPPSASRRLALPRPLLRDPSRRGELWIYRPAPGTEVTALIKGRVLLPEGSARAPVLLTMVGQGLGSRRVERVDPKDGSFQIGPLSPGTYSLEVGGDILPRHDLGTYVLTQHQILDLGVMGLCAEVPLRIEVRRSDGRQITWLRSRIFDERGEMLRTNFSGGLFQVEPLLPGKYELMVYSSELQCRNMAFELIAGEPQRIDVELEPGHRTQFRIRVPDGTETPERVHLTVRNDLGEQIAKIRPSGGALLGVGESCAFGPGSYQVEAVAGDLRGRVEFTVPERAEEIIEVVVEMRVGGR